MTPRFFLAWIVIQGAPGVARAYRVCPGPPDIQPNTIPRLYVDLAIAPGLAHLLSS